MNYEVNSRTLALVPTGENKSQILEKEKNYDLSVPTFKVMEHSCEYFGYSFNTRKELSQNKVKSTYKCPILIEDAHKTIFIPIKTKMRNNSLWISFNNILEYYPIKNKKQTVVRFISGQKMTLDVSFYSFNQQYLKAAKLSSLNHEFE